MDFANDPEFKYLAIDRKKLLKVSVDMLVWCSLGQ